METTLPLRTSFRRGAIRIVIVTSLVQGILGCFPVDDVFKTSCSWTMTQSLKTHYRVDVCAKNGGAQAGSRMVFSLEGDGAEDQWHWDCLKVFTNEDPEDISYLVKKSNSKKTLGFQCVKFSPLTPKVVREELSELFSEEIEANCATVSYITEEHVLVADKNLEPVACPIVGGYQVLMKLSDDIQNNKKCLEKTATYKPRLQFQCDQTGSSHVLADLGSSCLPGEVQMSPAMQKETMAHLDCVDFWHENSGTSNQLTNVLLRMQGSKHTFWCLHIQRVAESSHEVLFRSLITFDGRCVGDLHGQHSVPTPFTMFGHLAAFVPGDDVKCKEAAYLKHCETTADKKCQDTTDCPSTCGRCLETISPPPFSIPDKFQGNWESFPSEKKDAIIISSFIVKTPEQGDFNCTKSEEDDSKQSAQLALAQSGQHSTCMPYHTCAMLKALAPGLLGFHMIPAKRNDNGKLLSCSETEHMDEKLTPTTTFVQLQKLKETPCDIMLTTQLRMFNTNSDCLLNIHECQGTCNTFNISLDAKSCDNQTAEQLGLVTQHTCLAVLGTDERGIRLTRSPDTKQFLCWIQLSSDVFILSPENCNSEQIDFIMNQPPTNVPNTLHMLKAIVPEIKDQKDPQDNNNAVQLAALSTYPALALLTLALVIL